jgi:hypothetical protein
MRGYAPTVGFRPEAEHAGRGDNISFGKNL